MDKEDSPLKESRPATEGLEALRKRFEDHSRKAQAYYTIMHKVQEVAGSEAAASAWMEEPSPNFNGKTPAELVSEGRAEDVLAYIDLLKSGSSGK